MNMKKIGWTLLALISIAGLIFYYLYSKPVDSLENVKPTATLTADSIFLLFEQNEMKSNDVYLNKVISVSGKIQNVLADTSGVAITLQTSSGLFGVTCKMDETNLDISQYSEGQTVKIKGLCTGYLMDVILIRCVMESN